MYIIDNQVRIVQPPSTFWIYFESSKKKKKSFLLFCCNSWPCVTRLCDFTVVGDDGHVGNTHPSPKEALDWPAQF